MLLVVTMYPDDDFPSLQELIQIALHPKTSTQASKTEHTHLDIEQLALYGVETQGDRQSDSAGNNPLSFVRKSPLITHRPTYNSRRGRN